ncbi:hypothetical protein H6F89_24995 [Cyanobacteria bacterium FACHB-63]|nr:hypothetical protein [Cyanobacteria bacterium FACHB-63]
MTQLNEWRRVIRGIFLAIFLAVAVFAIALLLISGLQSLSLAPRQTWVYSAIILLSLAGYFVGITQLIYLIPLIIFLWRERRFAVMKGVVIGAVLVALVNFGCYLFVVSQFR